MNKWLIMAAAPFAVTMALAALPAPPAPRVATVAPYVEVEYGDYEHERMLEVEAEEECAHGACIDPRDEEARLEVLSGAYDDE